MPPKKKGKANKLARMSEEEKLRYLQHRAAIEEEAKRRKEHIISSYMKNKLKHEEAFTRLNTAKINQQWRQTLRQIKNKELHDATETLRQVFEIALKTKNKIIENLMGDLDNSEKQHSLAVKTHLIAIDKILSIRSGRMDTLSENYNSTRDRKMSQASKERERLENNFKTDKETLETMIHWEEICNEKNDESLKKKSLDYRNDVMHQLMSETRELEIQGNWEMEKLKREMQSVLSEYHKKFEPFQSHYKELIASDKKNIENYKNNCKIINEYEEMIKKLKVEVNENKEAKKLEVEKLESEIKEVKMEYLKIKKEVGKEAGEAEKMLKHLSMHSNATIEDLKDLEKTVDSIGHYSELCKKYMNEKELNLPDVETEAKEGVPLIEMTHFWRKFGVLQVEVTNLEAYYANYLEENDYLKRLLGQYMKTVARPTSVPSDKNKHTIKARSKSSVR